MCLDACWLLSSPCKCWLTFECPHTVQQPVTPSPLFLSLSLSQGCSVVSASSCQWWTTAGRALTLAGIHKTAFLLTETSSTECWVLLSLIVSTLYPSLYLLCTPNGLIPWLGLCLNQWVYVPKIHRSEHRVRVVCKQRGRTESWSCNQKRVGFFFLFFFFPFPLDVHCGNAKPRALALCECFISRRKTQMGRGRGWRADGLSYRNPSVLKVSFYLHTHAHTASCLLRFFLLPSLYSPFNADLITNMSSVRLPLCTLPPGFIWVRVQCSGSPKRHCLPASMGLPPWPRPQECLFPISLNGLKGTLLAWQLQEKEEKSHAKGNLKSIT